MTEVLESRPATRPVDDVIAEGRRELAALGVDVPALRERTLNAYDRIKSFDSIDARHYYEKIGYSSDRASDLLGLIKRFLALNEAWYSSGQTTFLSLPERVDSDGWHGLIIQTRDYARLSNQLGRFVHHATTEGAQDAAVTLTMAAMCEVFGLFAPELWEDCPGCIVYGWCSSSSSSS